MDMAPDVQSAVSSQAAISGSHTPNFRSPLPLSATQEAQVKDMYYSRVRGHCAKEIKDFANCARGRTISATWICRDQRLSMNSCMILHATQAEEDAARADWFAGRMERRRKREEEAVAVERRRQEVINLIKKQEEKEAVVEQTVPGSKPKPDISKGWWR